MRSGVYDFCNRRRILMPRNRRGFAVLTLFLVSTPADADRLDVLQGKFAFNWSANLGRQKCVSVAGPLLADFKSTRYRCDLKVISNTSTGASARVCTEVKGRKEYLIFDTLRACESERKTQESNE
jgi:hypothetical protein